MSAAASLYGLLAEYPTPEALVRAAARTRESGYRAFDAYTPMPVEGLPEAIGFTRTRMPLVILIGGILGGAAGYALQYWVALYAYPLNVGGRPLHSWPAFIPITFEMTILGAAIFGVLGMLALNGLPRPHHPLFEIERFSHVTRDGFFLCIESDDPLFNPETTRSFLLATGALEVLDVPR